MRQINVYPLPSLVESDDLKEFSAVVIDVLRATTVTVYAVAAGVGELIPMLDVRRAKELKNTLELERGLNSVLLGGERDGLPVSGFDLGNSPQHYTTERVAGKTLILTTTNGTTAMYAAKKAKAVFAAAFVNAQAVVKRLETEKHIAIICAGTDGAATEEDILLAGCLVSRLTRQYPSCRPIDPMNRNCQQPVCENIRENIHAQEVRKLWEDRFLIGNNESVSIPLLIENLCQSRGGENLVQLGLAADIKEAAKIDSINIVPQITLKYS
jgi:2-phosphosulfolactate phosphatase